MYVLGLNPPLPRQAKDNMTVRDILCERRGVCVQYAQLFEAMCTIADIRGKRLKGFAKGPGYKPGRSDEGHFCA